MSSAKWRPLCLGLNVLKHGIRNNLARVSHKSEDCPQTTKSSWLFEAFAYMSVVNGLKFIIHDLYILYNRLNNDMLQGHWCQS